MVALACSSVQHCCEVVAAASGTVGEDIDEGDIADDKIVDGETACEEFGYEGTDFLDGSFSNQETKKCVGLCIVPKVAKG